MRTVKWLLLITLIGLNSACSFFQTDEADDIPEQELYEQAMKAMEEPNYEVAIQKLEQLEARYPFGRYSEQAQLELIYAYYKRSEPEAAKAAADRFIRLHPQHENLDYAYYLRGLTAFNEEMGLVERYLPTDLSMRDPGAARDSFNDFALLLRRFPNSQYAPDAQARMQYLKNQLATYEIHVARYYLKRSAFLAAANRGRYVVENLQGATAMPDALAVMVVAYRELGLNDLAGNAESVLSANYPDYRIEQDFRYKPSLMEAATFGLFGKPEETPQALEATD